MKKDCIRAMFQRFCETSTVENLERSRRPSKITEERFNEVHHITENQQQTSVRTAASACSTFRIIARRIITEYLLLKPYKAQFVQKLDEEDF